MESAGPCKRIKLSETCSQVALDIVNQSKQGKRNVLNISAAVKEELNDWNALDVVSLHIVFSETDLVKAERSFKPKLAHQIFGQREKFQGYICPRIHLYFLANSAKCLFKFTHEGYFGRQSELIAAKIFDNLISWLPEDYFMDESKFIEALKAEEPTKMFGKKISEFQVSNKEDSRVKFIICECPTDEPGFVTFHERFQCFIVWYIDAASQLDLEDPNWIFIYVYEEIYSPHLKKNGYYPVGYCAVYKFFHYPDKIRTRISQCFVLPTSQRMGVGFQLLTATYQALCALPNVVDITVEDPCPSFQRLRDRVDTTLLREFDCFKYPLIKKGFTKKMIDDANFKYKVNKRQCRRVYHILRKGYALANAEEEDDNLLKDIQWFLGLSHQSTSKLKREGEATDELSTEMKIRSAIEAYTKEIYPVACSIAQWLKEQTA